MSQTEETSQPLGSARPRESASMAGQVRGPCGVLGDMEAELAGVWTFWLVEQGGLSHSLLGARFGGWPLLER